MNTALNLAESGLLPDPLLRWGIRRLVGNRLRQEREALNQKAQRLQNLRQSPVAIATDAANAQHYEVPADFFQAVLGPHLKYSACYWAPDTRDLAQAEADMLALYALRADLADGQQILDLGCGWGSFSLWAAARYRQAQITALSNSHSQAAYIRSQARQRGLGNLRVITADVNELDLPGQFQRIVSVEMFEHVRNYEQLLARIAEALVPGGKLFVHIFCHQQFLYPFEDRGSSDWMARHFFTGGLMPAADTLSHFQNDLKLREQWLLPGTHYQRTARAWLRNFDANKPMLADALAATYGTEALPRWLQRWRLFFMAVEEMFGYRDGQEWQIGHYLFSKPSTKKFLNQSL